MDSEQRECLKNLTTALRRATNTVRAFPFVYTAILVVLSPLEVWLAVEAAVIIGLAVFTSVPSAWLCWRLSRIFGMCRWYRAQCVVMLLPLAIPLSRVLCPATDIVAVWAGVTVVSVASVVNCLFVSRDQKRRFT